MIIYRIYNKIDNKSYIGQSTKSSFNQRYINSRWWVKPSNSYLIRAAEKYGKENFEVEILRDDVKSIEELYELESYYADMYNSYRPGGYNLIPCGKDKDQKELKHLLLGRAYNKPSNFTSNYKGVYYRKSNKKWTCNFNNALVKKSKSLNSEIEAAEMYDKIALYLYGEDAFINIENKREMYLDLDLEEFYENTFLKKKKGGYKFPQKYYNELIEIIKPLLWKIPIPKIAETLKNDGYTIKQIRYCISKYNISTPPKYYWQKNKNKNKKND